MLAPLFLVLASLPAWAIGAFGPTKNVFEQTAARSLLIRDGASTLAAIQLDPKSDSDVCTWIVPIPGELEGPIHQLDDESFESLLAATDPTYLAGAESPLFGCGCTEGISDTGEASAVQQFDKQMVVQALETHVYVGSEMTELLADIEASGMSLSADRERTLRDYGDMDWTVALVRMNVSGNWNQASPLLVYRYSGDEVVVPMALSSHNVEDEMQVVTLLVSNHRMDPVTTKGVKPKLGTPMYASASTRRFYNARFHVAIQEAGGHAWVLEYANTFGRLDRRVEEFKQIAPPTDVFAVFRELAEINMLGPTFADEEMFITRWRSFIDVDHLADESFAPASVDATYEISLDESDFRFVRGGLFLPFLAMGWWMRRRA
jgi:hypothetical protein